MKVMNLFREISMANVEGYSELSEVDKSVFDETYKRHLSSLNLKDRLVYAEENIVRIEKVLSKIKVYFINGSCYLYAEDFKRELLF